MITVMDFILNFAPSNDICSDCYLVKTFNTPAPIFLLLYSVHLSTPNSMGNPTLIEYKRLE
jgi:hypothetical protein